MSTLYLLAVWVHVLTIVVWIGAMLFEDPQSVRMTSRIAYRIGGIGWYAQGVLWTTGLFMLHYRRISPEALFSAELLSTSWGRVLWAKLGFVLLLLLLQIFVGNRPSKLVYAYLLLSIVVVGLSVMLVRPILLG